MGYEDPDHQTYTTTTTWIQAWWSPFFSGLSPKKVHDCPFPILPCIHYNKSPSSRNHLQFCAYLIYTMPAVFDIVIAKSDAYFYNTLVILCFLHFSLNSLIRFRLISMLIENKSNFLEWTFSVRYYKPRKFSSVPRCQHILHTRSLLVFHSCLILFKIPYIVGSGFPVWRAIVGTFQSCFVESSNFILLKQSRWTRFEAKILNEENHK